MKKIKSLFKTKQKPAKKEIKPKENRVDDKDIEILKNRYCCKR